MAGGTAEELLESGVSVPDNLEDARFSAAGFEEIVRTHRPRVFRFALASLRDVDAAQTVTQDCFYKAFKARDHFRGDVLREPRFRPQP